MLLRNLLPLLSVILSVQAYTLPVNTTDGVFTARVENGVEIHERVKGLPSSRELRSKRRSMSTPTTPPPHILACQSRSSQRLHCGCDRRLVSGYTDNEVAALKAQLDQHQRNHKTGSHSYYIIRGNVVALLCYTGNYSHGPLTGAQYAVHLRDITNSCGWYTAGTASVN